MPTYPIILHPVPGASVVLPSSSKKTRRVGASEMVNLSRLFRLGLNEIREDVCVKIDGHNYEPDYAYIDKENGIFIDIEVDEPYSTGGKPTHYLHTDGMNSDSARNQRFIAAGWYVARFSEEQIFCHTAQCMKEVYKLLLQAGAIAELPKKLRNIPNLQPMPRWTANDSAKMKRSRFRKSYLGYDPLNMDWESNIRCVLLIIPIIFQSIFNGRIRKCLVKQLHNYFFKSRR